MRRSKGRGGRVGNLTGEGGLSRLTREFMGEEREGFPGEKHKNPHKIDQGNHKKREHREGNNYTKKVT